MCAKHIVSIYMKIKLSNLLLLLVVNLFGITFVQAQNNPLSLAGTWQFSLDPNDKGLKENWQGQSFDQTITLPGTTDEAHYGEKTSGSDFGILTRAYKY